MYFGTMLPCLYDGTKAQTFSFLEMQGIYYRILQLIFVSSTSFYLEYINFVQKLLFHFYLQRQGQEDIVQMEQITSLNFYQYTFDWQSRNQSARRHHC